MAVTAIAISFLVMIIAVAVSSGFRTEIRKGISSLTGDVLLTNAYFNYTSDTDPVRTDLSYLPAIEQTRGVAGVTPVIYRAGIVKSGEQIEGVLFKGTPSDTASMGARIPEKLAKSLSLKEGDSFVSYFIGEKTKARRFTVTEVCGSMVETDGYMTVYVSDSDLRRLNGWDEHEASMIEVTLDESCRDRSAMREMAQKIGAISSMSAREDEDVLVSTAASDKFSQIFDWLDLIDFNVVAILLLMTVVAGFNMISGLLILLFRNISTIGTLKSLGMTDRAIGGVFMRVSARIVGKGLLIGNVLALAFCLIQGTTHLLKLNPENYFVPFVPVNINVGAVLLADIAAAAAIMLLLLIPCLFISKIDPSETVKTE